MPPTLSPVGALQSGEMASASIRKRHRLFADMLDATLAGGLGRITSSAAFDHRTAP
jgi:hypothetical protein